MRHFAVVTFNDDWIECRRSSGLVERVNWSELQSVVIKTTADGPFNVDLFWILVGEKGGCVVPAEADGERKMLERLQKLPDFDNLAVIKAMSCVDEQTFVCWKRKAII